MVIILEMILGISNNESAASSEDGFMFSNTIKEKIILAALWFFGIVFTIRGITILGESILGGFFMMISGMVLLPILHKRISKILNKHILTRWFVFFAFVLGILSGFSLQASEKRALENGTASPEQVKRASELNEYRENERIKREQEDEKKLADKEAREQWVSAKTTSPSNSESSTTINFKECRTKVLMTRLEVTGHYKTATILDTDDVFISRICTNDGSVLITCSAPDQKMITSKSNDCPL